MSRYAQQTWSNGRVDALTRPSSQGLKWSQWWGVAVGLALLLAALLS